MADDHFIQPSATDCLHDDFPLDALYEIAFPNESASITHDRKVYDLKSPPQLVLSASSARPYDAIQIINFTSHIFRGLSCSRLQFNVRIKVDTQPHLKMLLNQKKLFAEASLCTPQRIISDSLIHRVNQQHSCAKNLSGLLTYRWSHDLCGKHIDSTSSHIDSSGREVDNCQRISLEVDKNGALNYFVSIDIHQQFLSSSQAEYYDIDVAKDMGLQSIEVIRLFVDLKDCSGLVVAGACSCPIYVTNFAFSIEERFSTSPFIKRIHNDSCDPEFAWYCKNGGDNASVDVVVHLRDAKGRFVKKHSSPIPTTTQLVYSDGSPAPEMPLAPLKERKTATASSNPLFRRVRADPIILPNQSSSDFSFRIEEVSMHHIHKGGGFRIRVYTEEPAMRYLISPGLLEEVIVVRSKARKGELPCLAKKVFPRNLPTLSALKRGFEEVKHEDITPSHGKMKCNVPEMGKGNVNRERIRSSSSTSRKARKISVELQAPPFGVKKDCLMTHGNIAAKIPTFELFRCLYNEKKCCLWCQTEACETTFLRREQHTMDCILRVKLLETIQLSENEIKEEREPAIEIANSREIRAKPPYDNLMMELSVADAFLFDIDEHHPTATLYSPGDSFTGLTDDVWHLNSNATEALDYPPHALFRFHDFDTFYPV